MVPSQVTPWLDRTLLYGKGFVGDDQIQIDIDDPAKTLARFAGADGTVKGEEVGSRPLIGYPAPRALKLIAEGEMAVRAYPYIEVTPTEGLKTRRSTTMLSFPFTCSHSSMGLILPLSKRRSRPILLSSRKTCSLPLD